MLTNVVQKDFQTLWIVTCWVAKVSIFGFLFLLSTFSLSGYDEGIKVNFHVLSKALVKLKLIVLRTIKALR